MTDLRTAAQQALEALEKLVVGSEYEEAVEAEQAIDALRAALAEPVQEPDPGEYHGWVLREVLFEKGEPVGHREPVQEPVAKVELMLTGGNAGLATRIVEIDDHLRERLRPGQLLYTAPPQRKPLTEEEIIDLWAGVSDPESPDISMIDFARAIERAHGIGEHR